MEGEKKSTSSLTPRATTAERCEANDGVAHVLGVLVLIISCVLYQIHTLFVALLQLFLRCSFHLVAEQRSREQL